MLNFAIHDGIHCVKADARGKGSMSDALLVEWRTITKKNIIPFFFFFLPKYLFQKDLRRTSVKFFFKK